MKKIGVDGFTKSKTCVLLSLPSRKQAAFRASLRHEAVYETSRVLAPAHAQLLQIYLYAMRKVHCIVTRMIVENDNDHLIDDSIFKFVFNFLFFQTKM